jgi:aspartyl protease
MEKFYAKILVFALIIMSGTASALEIRDVVSQEQIQAMEEVETIRRVGTVSMGGLTGDLEIIYAVPDRWYMKADLKVMTVTQCYDGSSVWMLDQNNMVFELTGADRKGIINEIYLNSMSYILPGRLPGEVTHTGDTVINNIDYHVFLALPLEGDSIWLYFNTVDGRTEMVRSNVDELTIMAFADDFRMVDGLELHFSEKVESSNPLMNSTVVYNSIEVNVPVDESIFRQFEQQIVDYAFPADLDSVVIPINYENGHISLMARIGAKDAARFNLDTGAGMNIIDSSYADQIGLDFTGELPAKGVSGYETAAITHIDTLSIGEIRLIGQKVAVVDLSGINFGNSDKLGGILGYDLVSRFPIKVNYNTKKLIIYNPDRFIPPDSLLSIEFHTFMRIPIVPLSIGGCSGDFMVDLGNSLGLVLHMPFLDKCNIHENLTDKEKMIVKLGGIGGISEAYAAVGHDIRIGMVEMQVVPLIVAESKSGVFNSRELDGNIGNLMLDQFSVLLDYNAGLIYLLPAE